MKIVSTEFEEISIDANEKEDKKDTKRKDASADGNSKRVNLKLMGLSMPLNSGKSTRISLESIRLGKGKLNKHRQALLNKVLERDTWAWVKKGSVTDKDLAYISAATGGDEFTLLTGKNGDVLYHGERYHCHIEKYMELMELLEAHKLRVEVHTHPDYDTISASKDDRLFISRFGQKTSRIVSSYTGEVTSFHADFFEDY